MISEKINKSRDELARLKTKICDISTAVDDAFCVLKTIDEQLRELIAPSARLKSDALLVRKVAALLVQSEDLNAACHLVAEETGLSAECVYFTFIRANKIKNMLERHARHYTALKMKKSGFTAAQIAEVLGVSEKYVYKLITAKIEPKL